MERAENTSEASLRETDDSTSLVPVPRPFAKVSLQRPSPLLGCMPSGVASVVFQGQPVIVLNVNNSLEPQFNFLPFPLGRQDNSLNKEQMKLLQSSIQQFPALTNSVTKQPNGIPLQLPMIMSAEPHGTRLQIVPISDTQSCVDNVVIDVPEAGADVPAETARNAAKRLVSDEMPRSACEGNPEESKYTFSQLNESNHLNEDSHVGLPSCCSPILLPTPVPTSVKLDSRLRLSTPNRDLDDRRVASGLTDYCTESDTLAVIPVGGVMPNGLGLLTQETKEVFRMEDSDDELDLPETIGSDVQLFTPAPDSQCTTSAGDSQRQVSTSEVGSLASPLGSQTTSQCLSDIPNGQGSRPSEDNLTVASPTSFESRQDMEDLFINLASHPSHSGIIAVSSVQAEIDDIAASFCYQGPETDSVPIKELEPVSVCSGSQSPNLLASPLQANLQVVSDEVSQSASVSVVPVSSCSESPRSTVFSNSKGLVGDSCRVVPDVSSESMSKMHLMDSSNLQNSNVKRDSGSCNSICNSWSVNMAVDMPHTAAQCDDQNPSLMQAVPCGAKLTSHISSGVLSPVPDVYCTSPLLLPANACVPSSSANSIEKSNLKRPASLVDDLSFSLSKKPLTMVCTDRVKQDQTPCEDLICKNDVVESHEDSTFCEEDDVLLEPLSPVNECSREPIETADDGRETLNAALPSSAKLSTSQRFNNFGHDSDSDGPDDDDDDHGLGTHASSVSTGPIQPFDTVHSYCSVAVPTDEEVGKGNGELYLYPETAKVRNDLIHTSSSFGDNTAQHSSKAQEFPHRPLYSFSNGGYFSASISGVCPGAPMKPRLRIGLSRRQRVQPLHQQNIYKQM